MRTKILTFVMAIALSISFSSTASAQLNVVVDRSEEHALITAKKFGNYFMTLREKDGVYYVTVSQTTNQFDDKYNGVTLGIDKKSCLATIDDLLKLAETKNEVIIEDRIFDKVTLWGTKAFGVNLIGVQISGNAGHSYYYTQDLKIIRDYIVQNVSDEQ